MIIPPKISDYKLKCRQKTIFIFLSPDSIIAAMNTKIYLAPMAGITDLPFRLICREFGAAHCFLEMLDSRSLIRVHPKSIRLLKTHRKDSPLSAQLLGADPQEMLDAAEKLLNFIEAPFLDINSACPARKVIKKKSGAYLLKDTQRLGKIISKLASNLKIPVTVKLRTGFNKRDIAECVKTARICQENGASTVFMHGRTMQQGYSGDIDYESIRAVKEALTIPVFGSGNIFSPSMAKRMVDETGCDGILVARGAFGNPWIFKNIEGYLEKGTIPKAPSLSTKKRVLKKHLAYIEKYKDISAKNMAGFMGKVTMWYLKGIPNATKVRAAIGKIKSYKELIDLINRVERFFV